MGRYRYAYLGTASQLALAMVIFRFLLQKYSPDQPRNDLGQWTSYDEPEETGSIRTISFDPAISRFDQINDPEIDAISEKLLDRLLTIVEIAGPGGGPMYGTLIHARFAEVVRADDIPGIRSIGVEQSWGGIGEAVRYGVAGSLRTDVVLRSNDDGSGDVRAVWDVKTGGARLTAARVQELREQLAIGDHVPIFEVHAARGNSMKAEVTGHYRQWGY